jgi:hypothetical protein
MRTVHSIIGTVVVMAVCLTSVQAQAKFDGENIEARARFGKAIGFDNSPVSLLLGAEALISKTQYLDYHIGIRWDYGEGSRFDAVFGQLLHSDGLNAFLASLRLNQRVGWGVELYGEFEIAVPFSKGQRRDYRMSGVRIRGFQSFRYYFEDYENFYVSLDLEEETFTTGSFKFKVGPKVFYKFVGFWIAYMKDTNDFVGPREPPVAAGGESLDASAHSCPECNCADTLFIGLEITF